MQLNEAQIGNDIDFSLEHLFAVNMRIQGRQDILFHRWNDEEVQAKAAARKGSEEKKRDNPEAYVYRNDEGFICIL